MHPVFIHISGILASFMAGWYFYCHLYGVENVTKNTVGSPSSNPLINGLGKILFSYPDLLSSYWVIVPLYLIHLILLVATFLVTIATLFMSLTDSYCILIMGLPYVAGASLRYWKHLKDIKIQEEERHQS